MFLYLRSLLHSVNLCPRSLTIRVGFRDPHSSHRDFLLKKKGLTPTGIELENNISEQFAHLEKQCTFIEQSTYKDFFQVLILLCPPILNYYITLPSCDQILSSKDPP